MHAPCFICDIRDQYMMPYMSFLSSYTWTDYSPLVSITSPKYKDVHLGWIDSCDVYDGRLAQKKLLPALGGIWHSFLIPLWEALTVIQVAFFFFVLFLFLSSVFFFCKTTASYAKQRTLWHEFPFQFSLSFWRRAELLFLLLRPPNQRNASSEKCKKYVFFFPEILRWLLLHRGSIQT